MYVPASYREHEPAVMHDFLTAHPLGALVTSHLATGLFASHVPFLLDRTRGTHGTLEGHIARANPHATLLADGDPVLVIFTGENAYVTPSHYAAKREHGKVVPTWNYVAVHAAGVLRLRGDEEFLRRHLHALTAHHEAPQPHPWAVHDAPEPFIAAQCRAIVGIEIEITRLDGKWKMSQNRSDADIDGVVSGMRASHDARMRDVGEIVERRRPQR